MVRCPGARNPTMTISAVQTAWKALRELGPGALALYGQYRLGLASGSLRRRTLAPPPWPDGLEAEGLRPVLPGLPAPRALAHILGSQGEAELLSAADEVAAGRVRLFGGEARPLHLVVAAPLAHWTVYQKWPEDIKLVWEPGRFGWAFTLGRAYHLSAEPRFARAFWAHAERFWDANRPYLGPHWASAQEVALRLMALAFAGQVFAGAVESTPPRLGRLARSIAAHAARIPPTLAYARSQNNNHLLSEAVGLITAGLALPQHPLAAGWRRTGWRWWNAGVQGQITPEGAYAQHSTNYQRLALQLALWAGMLASGSGVALPERTAERLRAATRWMLALLDPHSGRVPNLGPNDGALVLPLAAGAFEDHRPTLQAASLAFLGRKSLPDGPWDETALWLGLSEKGPVLEQPAAEPQAAGPLVLRNAPGDSWAYLRAARFHSRPGHADQLHLDLWWRGQNVAMDPGTYRYSAPPPWDNALVRTAVHNTLTVDGRDQMTPAGRFLWLDWAQATRVAGAAEGRALEAEHNGYRKLGVVHRRRVEAGAGGGWTVEDVVQQVGKPARKAGEMAVRLHWLLPDWGWELSGSVLRLRSPHGWVALSVETLSGGAPPASGRPDQFQPQVQLVRAGVLLAGEGVVSPTWGWVSPKYDQKQPALSLGITWRAPLPLRLVSRWEFA
jgi:hypothetical protein